MPKGNPNPENQWQPGFCPNPKGRTSTYGKSEVIRLAREMSVKAVKTLADICEDMEAPPAARVTAAQALLDRGWGKPTQPIDANVNIFDRLTEHEQAGLLAALDAIAGEPGSVEARIEATH